MAFVSYNLYPGWHFQAILREAMLFHLDGETEPQKSLHLAREMLDILVQFPSGPENYYMTMIRDMRDGILQQDELYLFHEFLEEVNRPVYYHEFVAQAAAAALKPVAEARYSKTACAAAEPVKAVLANISDDPTRREVYLDFLHGRSFRRTVLCHAGIDLLPTPSATAVEELRIAMSLPPGRLNPEIAVDTIEGFRDASNQVVTIDHPVLKGAALVLAENFPQAIAFDELWQATLDRVAPRGFPRPITGSPSGGARELLARDFPFGLTRDAHSHVLFRPRNGRPASHHPAGRHRAQTNKSVTNLRHEPVTPTRFDRYLLGLLDGQRTHDELFAALDALVTDGKLTIRASQPGPLEPASRRTILAESLRQGLARLASRALLVRSRLRKTTRQVQRKALADQESTMDSGSARAGSSCRAGSVLDSAQASGFEEDPNTVRRCLTSRPRV